MWSTFERAPCHNICTHSKAGKKTNDFCSSFSFLFFEYFLFYFFCFRCWNINAFKCLFVSFLHYFLFCLSSVFTLDTNLLSLFLIQHGHLFARSPLNCVYLFFFLLQFGSWLRKQRAVSSQHRNSFSQLYFLPFNTHTLNDIKFKYKWTNEINRQRWKKEPAEKLNGKKWWLNWKVGTLTLNEESGKKEKIKKINIICKRTKKGIEFAALRLKCQTEEEEKKPSAR